MLPPTWKHPPSAPSTLSLLPSWRICMHVWLAYERTITTFAWWISFPKSFHLICDGDTFQLNTYLGTTVTSYLSVQKRVEKTFPWPSNQVSALFIIFISLSFEKKKENAYSLPPCHSYHCCQSCLLMPGIKEVSHSFILKGIVIFPWPTE